MMNCCRGRTCLVRKAHTILLSRQVHTIRQYRIVGMRSEGDQTCAPQGNHNQPQPVKEKSVLIFASQTTEGAPIAT